MTAISKIKVDKYLKAKKLDGELRGDFTFSLRWPLGLGLVSGKNYVAGPSFTAGGSTWSLYVYPSGIDDANEFLSLRLVNLSSEEVYASYQITIKNQSSGGEDYSWRDPEQIVLFSSVEEGDNAWGNDEFILLSELDNEDYTLNNDVFFRVELEIFGRDHLKTETLSQAILETGEKDTLIKLADEELLELTKKLPVLRDSDAQRKQEDGLVRITSQLHPKK